MGLTANLLARRYSKEQLEAQLDKLLTEQLGAKALVEWQVGDSAGKKMQWLSLPPSVRLHDVALALSILDPDTYSPDEFVPITQTRPTFS
jgi:hypothetical protein